MFKENEFIKTYGVYLPSILAEISKSKNTFQPLFEAFTNSLEAIKSLINSENYNNYIKIDLFFTKDLLGDCLFEKIKIEDNGIGFNDEQFKRFITLKDNRKGFQNRGSGRVQYAHFFTTTEITSIYKVEDRFYERKFLISKDESFLKQDALIQHLYTKEVKDCDLKTTIIFNAPLNDVDISKLNIRITNLKTEFIKRYLGYFCANRDSFPRITFNEYVDNILVDSIHILKEDIPQPDKNEFFSVEYSKISNQEVSKISESEQFNFLSFKLNKNDLEKNEIYLLSKGERIENKSFKMRFNSIMPEDSLGGYRFLILISSDYLSLKDGDERGALTLLKKSDFIKNKVFYEGSKEILFEDIESSVDSMVDSLYPEIKAKSKEKNTRIETIKKMFLFNDDVLNDLSISLADTEEKIIEKFHKAESTILAKRDVEIFKQVDKLSELDPSSDTFDLKLIEVVDKLTKDIPLQNRTALTHYVARRKIILELFQKVLDKELDNQKTNSRNNDEQILHNLLFRQSTTEPNNSDLWLINEDFIYFNGTSETKIKDIKINGEKIIREDLTNDEIEYINSLGENRLSKRTDILLFPEESKCIIIELKNPNVNVSEHLNQINRYATLLRNLTKEKFNFDTFYGYLIGENISAEDIRDFDSDFKNAYHFDYVFRPKKDIVGKNGRPDGSLYTEVIKYSTLLERAKKRNEIFINKLDIKNETKTPN